MLKFKEIYSLPSKAIPLTDWVLESCWFPELGGIWEDTSEVLVALAQAGRLTVKELVYNDVDGNRYAAMHTVWLDGKPVLVAQDAGRSGRDHRKRWVTDLQAYAQLLMHIASLMVSPGNSDFIDPETEVYEETVFHFYGTDFSEKFGFKCEPRRTDVCVMGNTRGLLPREATTDVMVTLKIGSEDVPEYIRRNDFVMQKVRLMTRAELDAQNPRICEVNDADKVDRVYLFRPCARPRTALVQPV